MGATCWRAAAAGTERRAGAIAPGEQRDTSSDPSKSKFHSVALLRAAPILRSQGVIGPRASRQPHPGSPMRRGLLADGDASTTPRNRARPQSSLCSPEDTAFLLVPCRRGKLQVARRPRISSAVRGSCACHASAVHQPRLIIRLLPRTGKFRAPNDYRMTALTQAFDQQITKGNTRMGL